ncbi:MAG: HAD family phosphatase [Acidobacteria bacterium]|nr:HAD family phosphatase [Acidobacteriota bacterium]
MTSFTDKAFIFDMDGTLVDNMHVHTEAWRQLIEENGLVFNKRQFLVETAGQTNREIIPKVFIGASDDEITELAKRKEELYREAFLPVRKPVAGLIEFLDRSLELGIKMAVATAASNTNMEFILDGLELRKYFDAITTATDVTIGKPDPAMFLVSAEKLDVAPEKCIVFEDAFGGFEAALRAGMKAIAITTVNPAEEVLKAEAVVEAHQDFTGLDPKRLVELYTT